MDETKRDANQQAFEGVSQTAEEVEGNAITQEQIRDVYFAGTSDGMVILNKGKTLNIKEQSTDVEK